jgi:hypothetical protein
LEYFFSDNLLCQLDDTQFILVILSVLIQKILSDCITKAGIWNDDSQIDDGRVIRLPVSKLDPHCTVTIEAL